MKRRALGLCLLLASTAPISAAPRIISLEVDTAHRSSQVWSGKFRAANGRLFNMSHLYRANSMTLSGTMLMALRQGRLAPLLAFGADAGYRATLYRAQPSAQFGMGVRLQPSARLQFSFLLNNLAHIGGKIAEMACIDSFARQYHCGTGLAWRDYRARTQTHNLLRGGVTSRLQLRYHF